MIKHKNIQRAAKVMLSALLVNAMFAVPAVHAEQEPITTSNIQLNRVIPHYVVSSPSMVHLLQSSKSFDFRDGDNDLLGKLLVFGKPSLHIPSDGFIRSSHIKSNMNTGAPVSRTSSSDPSSDTSGVNVSTLYAKARLSSGTLDISLIDLAKHNSEDPMATISDHAKHKSISDNSDETPVIDMKYRLHNAFIIGNKGSITLYPYEETKYNYAFSKATVKRIPVSKQKYYPITLKIIHKCSAIPSQRELRKRRLHKRSYTKHKCEAHIQKHHHKHHIEHKIRSGHVPY